jgi:hypothetical protein
MTQQNPPPEAPRPPKQPYLRPEIEEIKIASDEAMLGFCKAAGGSGGFPACAEGGCSAAGS